MTLTVQQIKQKFDAFKFTAYSQPNPIGLWENEQECLIWCCLQSNCGGHWMEIGTYTGGSSILMCLIRQELQLPPYVYSVDVNFDRMDGLFDRNMERFGLKHLSRKIKCNSKELVLPEDTQLDFVLIDGHHSFRYCLWDFEAISPYIHNDTIIAFHDVSPSIYAEDNKNYLLQLDQFIHKNYNAMMMATTPSQDYRIDEAVRYICKTHNYKILTIPCRKFHKTQKVGLHDQWIRGCTSPFNAFVAIRKRKQ